MSSGGRPRDVILCEACQWVAQGMDASALDLAPVQRALLGLLADCEVIAGIDPDAGMWFSWQDCDGCGAGAGLRRTYRARPVSQ